MVDTSPEKLAKLETAYAGYIEGDLLDQFYEDFDIRFAAGHWCAGEFVDRFATGGYSADDPHFERGIVHEIERVAKAHIEGVEFHDSLFIDEERQKDDSKVKEVKDALARFRVVPTNMNTNIWTDPKWKMGGICNPDPAIRRDGLALCLQAADMAKEVGCRSVSLWPGSDGWDYNFEANYGKLLDWFIEGLVQINKRAMQHGLLFGTEAKPKEPREGAMVISTTPKAALVALEVNRICGGNNFGVVIDYGHEQMYGNEPADNLYLLKRMGVPIANFHVNNAKYHSNDEDRVTGTGDNWKLADFCYAAIDVGYDGWFGEDQFTYRMEQVKAMALSRELFGNVMKKALMIYARRDELEAARASGDQGRIIDVVKKILV